MRARRAGRVLPALTAGFVVLTGSAVTVLPDAAATPSTPSAASVEAARRKVEELQHRAEQAAERYDEARERLRSTRIRWRAAKERLTAQQGELRRTRLLLGRLAADAYREGPLSGFGLALGDDPDDMLARAGLVSTVSQRRADLARRLQVQQARAGWDADRLRREAAELEAGQKELAAAKREAEQRLEQAESHLRSLGASRRRALERASRDRARRAIAMALRHSDSSSLGRRPGGSGHGGAAVGGASGSGSTRGGRHVGGGGSGSLGCGGVRVSGLDARTARVIRYACGKLGAPYQWGASGPSRFDCSGFTRAAWRQAGVSLPHSSRMQLGQGTPISRAALRPGDLVFFYSPVSHVGIYLGHGLMIHSPHSGDVVRVSAMYGPFAGARRP